MHFTPERFRWAALLVVLAATVVMAPSARAQSPADRATAQGLFEEARALVQQGQPERACPKFEESQRLDPAAGTQFNLADCYERLGRTASAWTLFLEVAAAMRAQNQPQRESAARQRAAALEPRLSRVVVKVPEEHRVEGLAIKRDATRVGEAQWGSAVPVDPGKHAVRASAPGYVEWTGEVEVEPGGAIAEVVVPALDEAPEKPAAEDAVSQQTGAGSPKDAGVERGTGPWRITAYALGGIGVAGLGVGAALGGRALSLKNESQKDCDVNACRTESGRKAYQDAQTAGTMATVGFAVGGAALAAGLTLFFLDPDARAEPEPSVTAAFVPLAGGGAVLAEGKW